MLETLTQIEEIILLWVQENVRNPIANKFFTFITKLGDAGFIWIIISLILLCKKKTRKLGAMCLTALVCSVFVNNLILKNVITRVRPFNHNEELLPIIDKPTDYSFPSGHTASSFSVGFLLYRYLKKPYGIVTMVLAVLIAFSRLYLGVHYPSDILCGMISGIFMAFLGEKIVDKRVRTTH